MLSGHKENRELSALDAQQHRHTVRSFRPQSYSRLSEKDTDHHHMVKDHGNQLYIPLEDARSKPAYSLFPAASHKRFLHECPSRRKISRNYRRIHILLIPAKGSCEETKDAIRSHPHVYPTDHTASGLAIQIRYFYTVLSKSSSRNQAHRLLH